jgi:hypothetical protein
MKHSPCTYFNAENIYCKQTAHTGRYTGCVHVKKQLLISPTDIYHIYIAVHCMLQQVCVALLSVIYTLMNRLLFGYHLLVCRSRSHCPNQGRHKQQRACPQNPCYKQQSTAAHWVSKGLYSSKYRWILKLVQGCLGNLQTCMTYYMRSKRPACLNSGQQIALHTVCLSIYMLHTGRHINGHIHACMHALPAWCMLPVCL